MKKIDRLFAAQEEVSIARKKHDEIIEEVFIEGTHIYYNQGVNAVSATVIRQAMGRIFIENSSGKQYWIHTYRVTHIYED